MMTEPCADDHAADNTPLTGRWLVWAWVMPQALLLGLNWRAWTLVRGDLSEVQRLQAAHLGLFEGVLLLLGMVAAAWWFTRRRSIGPWLALGTLGLHVGYLWFFLARLDKLMPPAVTLWMLPETELMFYQFSLIMPVIFLMLVGLARMKTGLSCGADIGLSVGLLVGIPASFYVGMVLFRWFDRAFGRSHFIQYFTIAAMIGATALILVAFLKLLIRLHAAICRRAWSAWVLPFAAGLVAPLSGMALNAHIPFPYDFQDLTVYLLTVVNGLTLLIPFRVGSPWALRGWIASSSPFRSTSFSSSFPSCRCRCSP